VVVYICLAALAWLAQYYLVFAGCFFHYDASKLPSDVHILELSRSGINQTFRVVHTRPKSPSAVVVFFGGNGEHIGALWYRCRQFLEYNALVYAVEYPGYGLSVGPASDHAIREAAKVMGVYARQEAESNDIPLIAVGSSLGGHPALHLLSEGIASKAFLHAPFTSMVDVASRLYWWLPVRQLLSRDLTFDNLLLAKSINNQNSDPTNPTSSVLILHGSIDEIVDRSFGKQLCNYLQSCQFVNAEGYKHNDLPLHASGPFGQTIQDFFLE